MTLANVWNEWKGKAEFGKAQVQMVVVLLIAYIGDRWPNSYPRNDNHNPSMFWAANIVLLILALASMKNIPTTRNVQLLSRPQTEEWKGWMQFAFIMYHYYRMYTVYNEIRVFVSAYGAFCRDGTCNVELRFDHCDSHIFACIFLVSTSLTPFANNVSLVRLLFMVP